MAEPIPSKMTIRDLVERGWEGLSANEWLKANYKGCTDFSASKPEQNSPGLRAYMTLPNIPKQYGVFDGVFTTDARFEKWCVGMYEELTEKLPPSQRLGPSVLAPPGVIGSWESLLSIQGLPHDPEGVLPHDSRVARTELGHILSASGSASDREKGKALLAATPPDAPELVNIARWIVREALAGYEGPKSFAMKHEASTGALASQKGLDLDKKGKSVPRGYSYKRASVASSIAHARDVRDLIAKNDLTGLMKRYRTTYIIMQGRRYQLDGGSWDKNRTVFTPKKRLVRTYDQKWMYANKRQVGQRWEGRSRVVAAAPFESATPLRGLARGMEAALKKLPSAAPARYRSDVAKAAELFSPGNPAGIFIGDGYNWEKFIWRVWTKVMHEEMAAHPKIGRLLAEMSWLLLTAPTLVKNDYRGQKGTRLEGDPFNLNGFDAYYENPSGHPLTHWIATVAMLFTLGIDHYRNGRLPATQEAVRAWLHWLRKEKDWAGGDNFMRNTPYNSPDAIVDYDYAFQGYVLVYAGGIYQAIANAMTDVGNEVGPLRGLGDQQKGDPHQGHFERKPHFATAPAHRTVDDIRNRRFRLAYGMTLDAYCAERVTPEAKARYDRARSLGIGAKVLGDLANEPDVLSWKYDIDDFPEEVIAPIVQKVDEDTSVWLTEEYRSLEPLDLTFRD